MPLGENRRIQWNLSPVCEGESRLKDDLTVAEPVVWSINENFINTHLHPARQANLDFCLKELRRSALAWSDAVIKLLELDFPRRTDVQPRRRKPGGERSPGSLFFAKSESGERQWKEAGKDRLTHSDSEEVLSVVEGFADRKNTNRGLLRVGKLTEVASVLKDLPTGIE